jgi:5-methylcytosine-specific restriction protein A
MICKHPGCTIVAPPGYCKDHGPPSSPVDEKKRNPFYDSARWRKCRARQLSRQPICEGCIRWGMLKPAEIVHHITPIEDGGAKLDPNNLASLCVGCHNEAHGHGDMFKK